ncbi:MAG: hypothetical protein M1438_20010 [Deltaproteobacteria bacterium]|nr:hypothetical protein [Deltaproteobacteria bacterium]
MAKVVNPSVEELAGEAFMPAVDSDNLVDEWLAEYFPATTISRDSAAWQHIQRAAAELKRRLQGA